MKTIIHPTYFPNIASFVGMVQASTVVMEAEDNFQKQTYRNRAYIYGANGILTLNIPVRYTQNNRQKYREVMIANDENWQDHHWKSIESAYRTSPFFEYYEDDLRPLFKEKKELLFDFNMECIDTISACFGLELKVEKSTEFIKDYHNDHDYRYLVNAKMEPPFSFDRYIQVFSDKHGYIPNLSILDLLFNEGPNTLNYLQSQSL